MLCTNRVAKPSQKGLPVPKQTITARRSVMSVVLAGSLALTVSPVADAKGVVLESGHMNVFNVTAKDGQLKLDLKEDITGSNVERAAEDVTMVVHKDAWTDATEALPQVGKPGYVLPQGYHQGMLRPGWTTLMARWDGFTDVKIRIDEITGPGEIHAFITDGRGGFAAATDNGAFKLASGSAIHQSTPAHRHLHWLFTQPGTYTMKATALSNGEESNQATYTWEVGQKANKRPIMDEPLSLERLQSLAGGGAPAPVTVDPVEPGAVPPPATPAEKASPANAGNNGNSKSGPTEDRNSALPSGEPGKRTSNGITDIVALIGTVFGFLQNVLFKAFWSPRK